MSMTDQGIGPAANPRYRAYVLALLMVVYTFNFIDRQILAILAPYIKVEMGFSDSQMGLLGGPAFALVYSTLALPIAWLADRKSRTTIIAAALAVWSAFTALCGFAVGFWPLFGARMGVGVGEAGGVAPSYSLVSAYRSGAILAKHVDRPQCRWNASVLLDMNPEVPRSESWPIFVESQGRPHEVRMEMGECLVYRGDTNPHWRDRLDPGRRQTLLLLHYVPIDFQGALD